MRRIVMALALIGMVSFLTAPSEASAAQNRSVSRSKVGGKRSAVRQPQKHAHHRSVSRVSSGGNRVSGRHQQRHAHARSTSRSYGGGGIVSRTLGTRLYYSNAFRGVIPGTGYGGFRRPAFGNRGY